MFSYAHPRESLNLPPGIHEGKALVPIDPQDNELREKHARYGLVTLTPLSWGGRELQQAPVDVVVALDPESPYYSALGRIFDAVDKGELPEAAYAQAYRALVDGCFEATPWIEYLPVD